MDAGAAGAVEQTARETEPGAVAEEPELAVHPGPRQYVTVAIWLAIATALEVAWYYTNVPHSLFVTLLLVLAFIKFSLVVLWFMHLRFDSRIFRRMFVAGLLLAISVYLIVLVIFGALNAPWLLAAVVLVGVAIGAGFLRRMRSGRGPSRVAAGPGPTGH